MKNHLSESGHTDHAKHSQHKTGSQGGSGAKSHDHSGHHRMMMQDFKRRFWISMVLTIPVLVLSPAIQELIGYHLKFRYYEYAITIISASVYFYGGWPFLKGIVDELKKKQPGMMTLIAVAITVAFFYSAATAFGLKGKTFFWELATLIDIMLLGHWLEMKSVLGASSSLRKLVELMPDLAHLQKNGHTDDVKIDELKKGDIVLVNPGEKIPADGIVTDGESYVNESMITGESNPVNKVKDSEVLGGTINGNGSLNIRVKEAGENSYLQKVINIVRDTQEKKSKTQNLADRIAFWLTVIALTAGFGTLATWLFSGKPFVFALERMATVMVITCPHALGLAVPLVVAIYTSVAAQNGLLIRNRTAFEKSRKISLLAFDKTGTLTMGDFTVSGIGSLNKKYESVEILTLAGAVEARSEHPIGAAIIRKIKDEDIDVPEARDFKAIPGKGIEARVGNRMIQVVSRGYAEVQGLEIPDEVFRNEAGTIVFVLIEGELAGFISMADEIRKESPGAIKLLRKKGIRVVMMTGDNKKVAESVSRQLGLDDFYPEILPDQKLEKIKEFQSRGEFVAMTGDGINDAPALAAADVGIAVGSGTDVAAETADIILVNSNPEDIASLIIFGRETYKKMIQNFAWATGYNVVAIPLAAGVLYGAGILISPAIGAVLMSLSTIIVAINAQLLRKKLKRNREQ